MTPKTIFVTAELWAKVKSDAALAGVTLTEYINDLLRNSVRARTN